MSRILATLKGLQRNSHHAYLNSGFRNDVNWWFQFLPHFHSVHLIKCGSPSEVFSTDACLVGGAGICGKEFFTYTFPEELLKVATSISLLEFITVVLAVKVWGRTWQGQKLVVKCDNEATVQVINSGRANNEFMQACARELIFLACKWDFELEAVHVPGEQNTLADWLSRKSLSSKYWNLFTEATNGTFTEVTINEDMWKFTCRW